MINEIKNIEIEMKKILNIIVILFFGLTFADGSGQRVPLVAHE